MKLLLLSACIFAVSNAHNHPPVGMAWAGLNVNGATGYVKVWGGKLQVSLNLNSFNWANAGVTKAACMASGLSYHIHFARNLSMAGVNSTCGPTNTGGHYDPWYACGGATDQSQCANKGGCIQRNYSCSPTTFAASPFACEVGDWSGKYGKLWPMGGMNSTNLTYWKATAQNQYEIQATELYNPTRQKSVVFHCGSPRFLCAPFVNSTTMSGVDAYWGEGLTAAIAGNRRMVADLGGLNGPFVEFGGGQVRIGGVAGMAGIEAACVAAGAPLIAMAVMIGSITATVAQDFTCQLGVGAAGGVFDPTVSCVPGSATGRAAFGGDCQNPTLPVSNNFSSVRCGNEAFNYSLVTRGLLNPTADPYLSAQGALNVWIPQTATPHIQEYRLMDQSTTTLMNKLFMVSCGSSKAWCAKIVPGLPGYVEQSPPVTATTTAAPPVVTTAAPPASTSGSVRTMVSIGTVLMVVVGMVV